MVTRDGQCHKALSDREDVDSDDGAMTSCESRGCASQHA